MVVQTFTSSDGIKIHAEAYGDPVNPAIVFIHGFSLSSRVWDDIFKDPKLLNHFYLIAYDVRGHGRTGKPTTSEGYESKLYADDLKAVLDGFRVNKPIALGWSMGGAVISDIFTHLPEGTLSGVVYLNSVAGTNMAAHGFARKDFAGLSLRLGATDAETNVRAKVEFIDACFNDPGPDLVKKWEWIGMGCMQPLSIAMLTAFRNNDDTKLFEAARNGLPTLFIYGTEDRVFDVASLEGMYRERFPALEVHKIEGGSHSPMADESVSEVAEAIEKFASRIFAMKLSSTRPSGLQEQAN